MAGPTITSGNMASPELTLQAAEEWTTEDFLAAEPYPLPEVSEDIGERIRREDDLPVGQRRKHAARRPAEHHGWYRWP